jgi:hypothetical protein
MVKARSSFMVLVAICAVLSALIFVYVGEAAGQIPDDQRPPLVTDYANYPGTPQAFLTPGCDFSGVLNPTFGAHIFATNTDFGPVNDLGLLPALAQDDLVRMAWTGVAPECVGSAVSFVVKVALGPSFDPNVDQLTGPNGGYSVEFLVPGPGEITFPMPDLARFGLGCDYQLDAIVGIPLRDVGPSGSFFSEALRIQQGKQTADSRTTVISAKNGTYLNCIVPTGTTTTVPTTTTPPTTIPPTTQPPTTAPSSSVLQTTSPPQTFAAPPPTAPTTTHYPFGVTGPGDVNGLAPLFAFAAFMLGLMFFAWAKKHSQNKQAL